MSEPSAPYALEEVLMIRRIAHEALKDYAVNKEQYREALRRESWPEKAQRDLYESIRSRLDLPERWWANIRLNEQKEPELRLTPAEGGRRWNLNLEQPSLQYTYVIGENRGLRRSTRLGRLVVALKMKCLIRRPVKKSCQVPLEDRV